MMEVKTQALMDSEDSLRRASLEMRRICEELESVSRVVGSMKSIDISRHKIRNIENNLEELASAVSQMACFLEMANETYEKTELNIEEKSRTNYTWVGWEKWMIRPMQFKGLERYTDFDPKTLFNVLKWK